MISANVTAWANQRGISTKTLERAGVASGMEFIPALEKKAEVICFPYWRAGKCVNVKYRAIESKDHAQTKGGELRFWNIDNALRAKPKRVWIVEGEPDALALMEAGLPWEQILSVPNGAPAQASDNPEDQDRYRFVDKALGEGLAGVSEFVLAGDMDAPGMALRQDLVRILGAARCLYVDWPKPCKDAGDVLQKFGAADLRMLAEDGAKEWPVSGLYRLGAIPEPPPIVVWKPFPEFESKLGFAPRTISVVTGEPGHGKTTLMMQIWFQICRDYRIRAALASFETRAKPHHRRAIRQFMYAKHEHELTDEEKAHADKWTDDAFRWIIHPAAKPELGWLLDIAEVAVIRNRCKVVQIDPWNKLESSQPEKMREDKWIGLCLDQCADFANDLNVHVQIVAHPTKRDSRDRARHPLLSDISGTKHWDNRADLGLSVHRPNLIKDGERQTEANLWVLKTRFEELGRPCKLALNYDLAEARYKSLDYATGPVY